MKYSFVIFILGLKSLLVFADEVALSINPEGKFVYICYPDSSRVVVLDTATNCMTELQGSAKCERSVVGIEHISVPTQTLEPPENLRVLRKNMPKGVLICLQWTAPSFGAKPVGYLICCENPIEFSSIQIHSSEVICHEECRPLPFVPCVYSLRSVDASGKYSKAVTISVQ